MRNKNRKLPNESIQKKMRSLEKIVILGCGGLSTVVIDIIKQNNEYEIVGMVDKLVSKKKIGDINVIGTDDDLPEILQMGVKKIAIAIGSLSVEMNTWRKSKYQQLKDIGFDIINIIQKDSYISETAEIGDGNIIIGNCYLGPEVIIGNGNIIHPFTSIGHNSVVGDFVHISQGVNIAGNCSINSLSFVGMGSNIVQQSIVVEKKFIKSGTTHKFTKEKKF
jgi:UDP-perosamine 4-acetyltransferase